MLLSHTVLSELYQEKLVTEDEVKWMKGEVGDLSHQLICIQYTKPPDVVTRTAAIADSFGYKDDAMQLRGW